MLKLTILLHEREEDLVTLHPVVPVKVVFRGSFLILGRKLDLDIVKDSLALFLSCVTVVRQHQHHTRCVIKCNCDLLEVVVF